MTKQHDGSALRWVLPLALAAASCSQTGTNVGATHGAGTGATFPATAGVVAAVPSGTAIGGVAGTGSVIGTSAAGSGVAARAGTGAAGIAAPVAGTGIPRPPTAGVSAVSSTAGTSATITAGVGGAGTSAAAGSGAVAGTGAAAGSGGPVMPPVGACTPPPMGGAISDYGKRGPMEVSRVNNTGPSSQYTMFRPKTLGMGGFMHPPVTWGNGVTTTPDLYVELLSTVASHGFVIIASNSTGVTAQDVRQGLEWLLMQNDVAGDFQGKLAVKCAGAIGYSMGGGAAVGAAAHPNVIATVSMHGLPGAADQLHGPLLLMTSTNDGFVTKDGFVKPCYDASTKQPTIMATENVPGATADFTGHLLPLGDSGNERAPLVAWLRLWIYGDQGTKDWFYGADCRLCKTPWIDIQRKNAMW